MIADLLPLYQEARKEYERVDVHVLELFTVDGHEVAWAEVTTTMYAHPRWLWGKAKDLPIRPIAYRLLVCECMLAPDARSLVDNNHPKCDARNAVVAEHRAKVRDELLSYFGGFDQHLDGVIGLLLRRSEAGVLLDDGYANRNQHLIDAQAIYTITGMDRSDVEPALARLQQEGRLVMEGRYILPPKRRPHWRVWLGTPPTDPRLRRQVIAYRRPVHDLRRANWKVVVYPWGGRWGYVVKRLHLPVSAPPLTIPTRIEYDAINACLAELRPA